MIVERDFPDHWKTKRLIRVLADESAPMLLIRLWGHCEARRNDILAVDAEAMASICHFNGDAKKLVKALIESRWIAKITGGYEVLGWRERNLRMLVSIENGKKGGRPRKDSRVANGITETEPGNNPRVSNGITGSAEKHNLQKPVESRIEKVRGEVPPTAPHGGQADLLSMPPAEAAKARMCSIIGRSPTRPISCEAQQAIAEMLPIPEEEFELIEWFYKLPSDVEIPELTWRRNDFHKLAIHWGEEVDRARRFREKNGPQKKEGAKKEGPPGWREMAASRWPGVDLPEEFQDLPPDVQRELQQQQPSEENDD